MSYLIFFPKNHKFVFSHESFPSLYVSLVGRGDTCSHCYLAMGSCCKEQDKAAAGGLSHLGSSARGNEEQAWAICGDADGPGVCPRSEVSQRETNECPILVQTCGTWKTGAAETVCRAEIETRTQRTDSRTWGEGDGTSRESGVDPSPPPRGDGELAGSGCEAQSSVGRSVASWRRGVTGLGGRSERGGICVHT